MSSSAAACIEVDGETLWARIDAAAPLDTLSLAEATPYAYDDGSSERRLSQSDRRRTFIALYAWAVPTREAIESIAAFVQDDLLLEVCAGSGLWARLLAGRGLRVVATDAFAPDGVPYVPIELAEAEAAVAAHPDCRSLLLVWPPFRRDCAYRALEAFAGDKVAYVGDARFTGDQRFHELLDREWQLRDKLLIPAWPGLDDHVYLYSRR